jgi:hypothetical protein
VIFVKQKRHKVYNRAQAALKQYFYGVLRSNNWEICVLIVYQPYFEFAFSQFNQQWKTRGKIKLNEQPKNKGMLVPLMNTNELSH